MNTSYASEINENPSALRESIERAEGKVLGTENHSQLEIIEPKIDRAVPYVLTGVVIIILIIVFCLHSKRSKKI